MRDIRGRNDLNPQYQQFFATLDSSTQENYKSIMSRIEGRSIGDMTSIQSSTHKNFMQNNMFAAVFCILIFVGFFAKDKMRLFGLTSVLFLSVLCYGVDDPDLQNYKRAYDSIAAGNDYTDLGVIWLGLCKFFASCGFDYYMYKSVIVLVSGFFILQLINHYVKNPKYASFVWVCYLIFPAVMDLVQLRFFLASSIAIWSTQFLIDKAKYGKGKFIILMLLASAIHSSLI